MKSGIYVKSRCGQPLLLSCLFIIGFRILLSFISAGCEEGRGKGAIFTIQGQEWYREKEEEV
jgi:hypothetical protein